MPMLQSEKLYRRWSLVAAERERGLSWEGAYRAASKASKDKLWAGTQHTMKLSYVTVQRVRRAIQHAKSEARLKWGI